ncbi:LysR family transcriptional regulator [Pollutimonas bauzanensis]|uniref:DNA-binding transcriptional regulator, LysR family n=1 Tax=Pollutimonas bauzanensis TaxID=658167 RepID=A0A1M6A451_9BURK|nr:LysR family transcriptional regulator [Pollutimonas bauzanensis]SHI31240.1 DNA-binding transcriptional regulator, LysR family [Pollutimonas bauzanensis]
MARINLHSMQILSAVSSATSLARAATDLHMTPSAISKRIAELEARFGTPLLSRHSTGVRLTPAGEIVVKYTDDLMGRVAEMSREVAELLSQQRGEIRIMSNTTAILLGLLEDITRFRVAHPGIRVMVLEGGSIEVAEAVKQNTADIGVCVKTNRMSGLLSHPYRQTDLAVVVPLAHPLASRLVLTSGDLAGYPIVWTPPIDIVDGASGASSLRGDVELAVRSFDVVLRSVKEGAGIAVIPYVAVPGTLPTGLAIVRLDLQPARFEVVVCHDPSIHSDAPKQQLIAWLASRHEQNLE